MVDARSAKLAISIISYPTIKQARVEWLLNIGHIPKEISLKLFLDRSEFRES